MKGGQHNFRTHEREAQQSRQNEMTITTQRTTANSPAQAAKQTESAGRRSRRAGAAQWGRSPVRSFASYGGGHGTE